MDFSGIVVRLPMLINTSLLERVETGKVLTADYMVGLEVISLSFVREEYTTISEIIEDHLKLYQGTQSGINLDSIISKVMPMVLNRARQFDPSLRDQPNPEYAGQYS